MYFVILFIERKNTVSLTLTKVKTYNKPGVYELSWEIDGSQNIFAENQLNYYTLYWCENDMAYPNQCNVSQFKFKTLASQNYLF